MIENMCLHNIVPLSASQIFLFGALLNLWSKCMVTFLFLKCCFAFNNSYLLVWSVIIVVSGSVGLVNLIVCARGLIP